VTPDTMKTLLISFIVLCGALTIMAANKPRAASDALRKTDSVVWAGLDYSMVHMYGTRDFHDTDQIFPEMFGAWNTLFIDEGWVQRVGKTLGKRVIIDISGMSERNKLAKPDQVIREDGTGKLLAATHLSDRDIADAVRSYELKEKRGVGVVFIIDRLVKQPKKGCLYMVFFNVESRTVLASRRGVYRAAGFGFRNHWFRVVKEAVPNLRKVR
jgi:hypothetical protein